MSVYSHIFWTRESLIQAMRDWHVEHGRCPTYREWLKAGRGHPCSQTLIRVFGSIRGAHHAAGLPPSRRKDAFWTEERITDAMLDFVVRHGRWPSQWDWRRAGQNNPPATTVIKVFGSWPDGKRAAGWAEGSTVVPLVPGCTGCGTEIDNQTDGCATCWNRHYRRALVAA